MHSEPCTELRPGWTWNPKSRFNPREDKPAFIKFAAVPPQAARAALTDGANMTYTEPKGEEEKSENQICVCPVRISGVF